MALDVIAEAIVCVGLMSVFLVLLGICGIMTDAILSRFPKIKKRLMDWTGYDDDFEGGYDDD